MTETIPNPYRSDAKILFVDPHDPFRYSNFIISNMGLAYLASAARQKGSLLRHSSDS